MSTDYTAHTMVAVRIPSRKLTVLKGSRGCNHPIPKSIDVKFCSQCGKPIRVDEEVELLDIENGPPKGSGVSYVTQNSWNQGSDVFVRAYGIECDPGEALQVRHIDMESSERVLKRFLEPLGLWNASEFGLWCVLEVS